MERKFLVLVPTLHSSRKDLYLYFSIVAIFCPSFPPSFASVRGAPISAFCGNSRVRSHFTPSRIGRSHSLTMPARCLLRIRSVASFMPVVTLQSGLCCGTSKSICACPTLPVRAQADSLIFKQDSFASFQ